ncbi:putative receptor-like protein kinase, partial [Corchorus capsularis]
MSRENLAILGLLLFLFLDAVNGANSILCKPSSCGALNNISSPFRLKGDPPQCGFPQFELVCENNRTILHNSDGSFYVQHILYNGSDTRIRLVDTSLDSQNCSILPNTIICRRLNNQSYIYLVSCKVPINSPLYIDASPCAKASFSSYPYLYVLYGGMLNLNATAFTEACTVQVQVPSPTGFPILPPPPP